MTKLRATFGCLLLLLAAASPAAEYIDRFHSDIEVRANGDLLVSETIAVHAEGRLIKRGIYRDFPTRYEDNRGRTLNVGFEVISVSRDGRPEPYHIEDRSNGKRVYIGDANVFLEPGFHEYRLSYRTTRQLGFFDDFDELYWNVTGNGWIFAINHASATVTLPAPVAKFRLTGYTGRQGSTAQNLDYRQLDDRRAYFETRSRLGTRQGLTIVAGWPKGVIAEPSAAQRRGWFIDDHKSELIVGGGTLALLVYYLLVWYRFGRDPAAGVIVPIYRPPEGYSPASMRYIDNMGYDNKCFTAAITNLAARGQIVIWEYKDDKFKLLSTRFMELASQVSDPVRERLFGSFNPPRTDADDTPLAAGERVVLDSLFGDWRDHVTIAPGGDVIPKAISRHEKSLKYDYNRKFFNTNGWLMLPPILASIILLGIAIGRLPSGGAVLEMIFVGLFSLAALFVVYLIVWSLLRRISLGVMRKMLMFVALWPLIFVGIFLYHVIPFAEFVASAALPLLAGSATMLAMHVLFYRWLRAPTVAGRRLLDKIEGFRHYLAVAEEDEIALRNAPTFTSDLYEAYLPYAIALDLENEWTAKLDRAIAGGLVAQSYSQPPWFRSHSRRHAHFSSALSTSLSTAITSSSVAPGSSSGSSGSSGGSSGGGGGGGGGGGW